MGRAAGGVGVAFVGNFYLRNQEAYMSLDDSIKKFRVASRELFNNFFHVPDPWNSQGVAWMHKENFRQVEAILFTALVDPEPIS
jgi:hypothetical protein